VSKFAGVVFVEVFLLVFAFEVVLLAHVVLALLEDLHRVEFVLEAGVRAREVLVVFGVLVLLLLEQTGAFAVAQDLVDFVFLDVVELVLLIQGLKQYELLLLIDPQFLLVFLLGGQFALKELELGLEFKQVPVLEREGLLERQHEHVVLSLLGLLAQLLRLLLQLFEFDQTPIYGQRVQSGRLHEVRAVDEFGFNRVFEVLESAVCTQLVEELVEDRFLRVISLEDLLVLGEELVDEFVVTEVVGVEHDLERLDVLLREHLGRDQLVLVEHGEQNHEEGGEVDVVQVHHQQQFGALAALEQHRQQLDAHLDVQLHPAQVELEVEHVAHRCAALARPRTLVQGVLALQHALQFEYQVVIPVRIRLCTVFFDVVVGYLELPVKLLSAGQSQPLEVQVESVVVAQGGLEQVGGGLVLELDFADERVQLEVCAATQDVVSELHFGVQGFEEQVRTGHVGSPVFGADEEVVAEVEVLDVQVLEQHLGLVVLERAGLGGVEQLELGFHRAPEVLDLLLGT